MEFKYLPKSDALKLEDIVTPDAADVAQVRGYAQDILKDFPEYVIRTAVCLVQGSAGFRWFDVDEAIQSV